VDLDESLRGQLLIASPALLDPNFARAVVLVVEHNDEGAMGIVLTRPSTAAVAEAVPPLEDLVADDEPVFVGGPVEPASVVVLAEFEDTDAAAALVFGDLGFLRADAEASVLESAARRFRVFAGYSGWEAGQLEAELALPSWIIEAPELEDVFSDDPEGLWSTVLRRKGGQFALLATMPPDPSVN
jgi:putative transcriptional regulator